MKHSFNDYDAANETDDNYDDGEEEEEDHWKNVHDLIYMYDYFEFNAI